MPATHHSHRCRRVRLQVRGLNVMLMVFVDNVGGWFQGWIDHSPWDVVHLADFVMPLFLFMVGVSMGARMLSSHHRRCIVPIRAF